MPSTASEKGILTANSGQMEEMFSSVWLDRELVSDQAT